MVKMKLKLNVGVFLKQVYYVYTYATFHIFNWIYSVYDYQ